MVIDTLREVPGAVHVHDLPISHEAHEDLGEVHRLMALLARALSLS